MDVQALTYEGLELYNTELSKKITALIRDGLPPGIITAWSGSADSAPEGWVLCDGQNGTPDLSGKFILGTSEAHPVGTTGGAESISLTTENLPAHTHTLSGVTITDNGEGGSLFSGGEAQISAGESTTDATGDGTSFSIMPPYYALAYIMKIS